MGIEELKRALQEREKNESWKNRIVKEEPLLQLSEENRKELLSRRTKFEQLSKRFSINETENHPPKLVSRPLIARPPVDKQQSSVAVTQNRHLGNETKPRNATSEEIPPQKEVQKSVEIEKTSAPYVINKVAEESVKSETPYVIPKVKEEVNTQICHTDVPKSPSSGKFSARPLNKKRLPRGMQEKLIDVRKDESTPVNRENGTPGKIKLGDEFTIYKDDCASSPNEREVVANVPFKLPADAFQTPIIGREHCGVKLRRVDTNSPFPDVMLIQFQGNRPLNVRSVSPKFSANFREKSGSYLLITHDRLIVWNAPNATVFNKSKATQMAYDIIGGKELACLASKVEIANDDRSTMCAFSRITGMEQCGDSAARKEVETEIDEKISGKSEIYEENLFFQFDRVFLVKGPDDVEILFQGRPPDTAVFHSTRVLIFDFITELYVWIGQNCDRALITHAVKYAEQLKNTLLSEEQCQLFGIEANGESTRPQWIIFRKQTQGIADCIFRFKFEQWAEKMAEITQGVPSAFLTPRAGNRFGSTGKRPWSVPAAFGALSASAMSNRISSMCSDNAYFGIVKDEEKLVNEVAADLSAHRITSRASLQLEGLELNISDENVYTESIIFLKLADEENLDTLDGVLTEFNHSSCYVIEWNYRIEREGIRKLNGDRIAVHETGRQRVAYFYWLGKESSIKDRSRCALALRKYDKNRQEHIRIEAGHEPPVFLNILSGEMIVSGTGSGYFLVTGSSDNLFSAEELTDPPEFRSQGAYLRVNPTGSTVGVVECWYGESCASSVIRGAEKLGARLAAVRNLTYDDQSKKLNAYSLGKLIVKTNGKSSIRLLKPNDWNGSGPRLYRIFGNEGEELCCERYDSGINFTFRQTDLRDCMLVDQHTRLWIWSEEIVSTFELKVADKLWYDINKNPRTSKEDAIVLMKGHEPDEFKALFPTWTTWETGGMNKRISAEAEKLQKVDKADGKPQYLSDLLYERTRCRGIDELRRRDLPRGFDTKHLERYLSDTDFFTIFQCTRKEYESLPRWKQIAMKKEAQLF